VPSPAASALGTAAAAAAAVPLLLLLRFRAAAEPWFSCSSVGWLVATFWLPAVLPAE
jgi:hypothetical protein